MPAPMGGIGSGPHSSFGRCELKSCPSIIKASVENGLALR